MIWDTDIVYNVMIWDKLRHFWFFSQYFFHQKINFAFPSRIKLISFCLKLSSYEIKNSSCILRRVQKVLNIKTDILSMSFLSCIISICGKWDSYKAIAVIGQRQSTIFQNKPSFKRKNNIGGRKYFFA